MEAFPPRKSDLSRSSQTAREHRCHFWEHSRGHDSHFNQVVAVSNIFEHFHPENLGKMFSPILTSIFFRWVGSTTKQLRYKVINYDRARHKLVQSDVSLGCRVQWKGGMVACIFPCFQRDNMDAMRAEVIIYLLF